VRGKDTYSVGSLRKSVAISAYVYQFALFWLLIWFISFTNPIWNESTGTCMPVISTPYRQEWLVGWFIPVAPTWSIGHPWIASFHFSFLF
jgi:hypothetical protein